MNNTLFIPCRITSKRHAEELIAGKFKMRSVSYYRGLQDGKGKRQLTNGERPGTGRMDLGEGAVASYSEANANPILRGLEPGFKDIISNAKFIDAGDLLYFKILCMYRLEFTEGSLTPIKPDPRMGDFGDTVVVFQDFNRFLMRFCCEAIRKYNNFVDLIGPVNYYPRNTNRILTPLFEKEESFAYQNELRIALAQSKPNGRVIDNELRYSLIQDTTEIDMDLHDSISDIAYTIPIEDFLSLSGIHGPFVFPNESTDGKQSLFSFMQEKTSEQLKSYHPGPVQLQVVI